MSVAVPQLPSTTGDESFMTAEEFARLPDLGQRTELVRGQIVETEMPPPIHGYYCANITGELRAYVKAHDLGRVMSNDSWVKTRSGPDTMRGADVAFWSYERLPKGELPVGVIETPPDLVIEVRSPSEHWTKAMGKVLEYLEAGVKVACILDPKTETLSVYCLEEFQRILTADDEFALPDILGDFRVRVGSLFT